MNGENPGQKTAGKSGDKTAYYVLIRGPSYLSLEFDAREAIRTGMRERLEAGSVRFVEYTWVWDEDDRCLLLVSKYKKIEEAFWWIKSLESMGFEICIRTRLPGEDQIDTGNANEY